MNASLEGFPLSPQQRLVWRLQSVAGRVFTAQATLSIQGALDAARLRAGLEQAGATHEILRTTFARLPGMSLPVQIIQAQAAPDWQEHDLSRWAGPEQADRLAELRRAFEQTPFDLTRGPVLRAWLVALAPTEHRWWLAVPALLSDADGLGRLAEQIARAYLKQTPMAAALQYADVAQVFNELLESDETAAGRAFWQRQPLPATALEAALPFEGRRSAEFHPHSLDIPLPPALWSEATAFVAIQGGSVELLCLAVWQLLLARLAQPAEIVVARSYDGRTYEGMADAPGLFLRALPLPGAAPSDQPFLHAYRELVAAANNLNEWQDYAEPSALWSPERHAAPQDWPYQMQWLNLGAPIVAANISFTLTAADAETNRYAVRLRGQAGADGWRLRLDYDAGLYAADMAQRLADQFSAAWQHVLRAPTISTAHVSVLGSAEKQLLYHLNSRTLPVAAERCLHHLLSEQAARLGATVAVTHQAETLTFAQLEAQANQLAHYLQARGVGPDVCVGLLTHRSVAAYVGLFGILKAGGAYITLDPTFPPQRLAYMLATAGASLVITQTDLQGSLPHDQVAAICLDADWERIAAQPDAPPPSQVTPANLAYVLFTSGSTGRPKGVMVEHRSVVNLAALWQATTYAALARRLRVSQNAPLVFDGSVKQWIQLLNGHSLYIIPEALRADPDRLIDYIAAHDLDVVDCTPTQLRQWLAHGFTERAAPAIVLVGGEAIDSRLWARLQAAPRTTFINVYGPTEATVNASTCVVRAHPDQPSIGRPLPNVQLHVLDAHQQPLPIGVAGEIYIGGAGLARGYISRADLTAERFVDVPLSPDAAPTRLYRTGDVGRWLPDGYLDYLGRLDNQVQLRGIRIELREIEAVLMEHPAVSEAVVVVHAEQPEDPHLAAYVKTSLEPPAAAPLINELRAFLRQRVPEYMVPRFMVTLNQFPLTPTGKINRRALPDPTTALSGGAPYVAPRNEVERAIVAVWQEVLGVERVGIHDNFFDLGGHSLLMAQTFERLSTLLERRFPLVEMYRHPTVSSLTAYLSGAKDETASVGRVQERVSKQRAALHKQRRAKDDAAG